MVVKQRAPRVGRWVERMTTTEPYRHEYDGEMTMPDRRRRAPRHVWLRCCATCRRSTSRDLRARCRANEWLAEHPEIEDGTNGLDDPATRGLTGGRGLVAGGGDVPWRGIELTTSVMPYRFWLMQRLHDDLATASADDAADVRAVFAGAGLDALLDLRTLRRVERAGHLEIWGPLD